MNNMNEQYGFTLIELLMVVSIIGILSAIAIPNYREYTLKAKVSEAFQISSIARQKVAKYYRYVGKFPVDNYATGLAPADDLSGEYIKSMSIENGAIHILFSDKDEQLAGKYLSLRPVTINNSPTSPIYFVCGYEQPNIDNQLINGKNKTNLDKNWLTGNCRGNK